MLSKLLNIFRIPELRNKLLFTIALLCVYRIGFYVPLPGVNAREIYNRMVAGSADNGAFAILSNFLSVFSGGDLTQGTIFGLGIMPYISASIILQLLGTVMPSLEKLKKEGEPGIRKINEWTRYLTVAVCIIQAGMYMGHLMSGSSRWMLYPAVSNSEFYLRLFPLLCVTVLTAGSVFLMWLGEQIDHFGIGNGISLIITAGIVARMPDAVLKVVRMTSLKLSGTSAGTIGAGELVFLIACFVFVVAGAILLTQAQRRIAIQQAKHMRGRRVYGGQRQYLPLRVNHAGVMPIVFAQSLMIFPWYGFRALAESAAMGTWWGSTTRFLAENFAPATYMYEMVYCAMIFFFSYFWNTVQFQPKEMANQLRDYGSFIPGLRPGKRTADYLENVMTRITYVGAAFLCIIAIVPTIVAAYVLKDINQSDAYFVSQFLGGTGLLIVISVMLDFISRIEANLVMRNYSGFMDDSGGGSPARIKRPSGGPVKHGPLKPQPVAYGAEGSPA